jgi:hypothetical protein
MTPLNEIIEDIKSSREGGSLINEGLEYMSPINGSIKTDHVCEAKCKITVGADISVMYDRFEAVFG